jgi:orotidine-5'-phosphate decarboxylase
MLDKTKGGLTMRSSEQEKAAMTMEKQGLTARDRLIVALDVSTMQEAKDLITELSPEVGMFKVGLELFTSCGTEIFEAARAAGAKLFFDGKFHDIPNTVAGACRAVVAQGPTLFNLHALGGRKMMEAAVAARDEAFADLRQRLAAQKPPQAPPQKPALIAVTVLTSMNSAELSLELKVGPPLEDMVLHLARMAQDCGLDGVVASAKEAAAIRQACGRDFLIVTPGIRPSWAGADDQSRIVTPKDAIAGGADMIVVGRPITKAKDKIEAARLIVAELETA